MDAATFASRYPVLWHMAEAGSLDSIRRHGLLSTSALLDLFEVAGEDRYRLEACHRPEKVQLDHPVHGTVVLRDQKPMNPAKLARLLDEDVTPEDWYRLLNGKVFFWVSEERLERMLGAGAYREDLHTVLRVSTEALMECCAGRVTLSTMNTGATFPLASRKSAGRGRGAFQDFDVFAAGGLPRVVELAVEHSVPDITDMILSADDRTATQ